MPPREGRKVWLPPPAARGQASPEQKARRAWNLVRAGGDLVRTCISHRKRNRRSFDATPEHLRRHGVSAAALLGIISEEQFTTLRNLWLSGHGRFVSSVEFLFLLRPLMLGTGRFSADGSVKIGEDELPPPQKKADADPTLSDLDNYIKELFVAVDRERRERISWEAFINYLIENALADGKYKLKGRADRHSTQSYVYKGSLFGKSTDEIKDCYSRLHYFPEWNRLVGLTKKRCRVLECSSITTHPQLLGTLEHSASILSAEYCEQHKVLLTSCINRVVRVWHGAPNPSGSAVSWDTLAPAKEFHTPQSLRALRWSPRFNCLFAGDVQGAFHKLDLEKALGPLTERTGGLGTRASFEQLHSHHSGALTAISLLPNDVVVTTGMDGRVFGYHTQRDWSMQQFDSKSGHKQGVYCMEHIEGYHFLITGGYEPHALAWVDNMPQIPAFRLADHNNPHAACLIGIVAFPATPQIATMDSTGVTKIFDIRTLHVLESFNARHMASESPVLHSVCYTGVRNRQLVYGSQKLYVFEHESMSSDVPRFAHVPQQQLLSCHYLPGERLFATVAARELKVWNADTGMVERVLSHLTESAITAAEVDTRSPGKMILGHRCGRVSAVTLTSGALLREYKKHMQPITALSLAGHLDVLAVGSADGLVTLWTDIDTPITRSRVVLPHLRKKVITTFAAEVRMRHDPAAAVRELFQKSASGEDARTTQTAAQKLLQNISERRGKQAYAEEFDTVLESKRRRAKKMLQDSEPASPEAASPREDQADSNASSGSQSARAQAAAAAAAARRERRRRPPVGGDGVASVIQSRPLGKLDIPGAVQCICFSKKADLLLFVGDSRIAQVHSTVPQDTLDGGLWSSKGPPRTHRLTHGPGTELATGCFVGDEPAVALSDTRGIIYVWHVGRSTAMCIARWYNTQGVSAPPPEPPVDAGDDDLDPFVSSLTVSIEVDGQGGSPRRRRQRIDPAAAALLASLRQDAPQNSEEAKTRHPVVPAVTRLHWHRTGHLFAADELGRMWCWYVDEVFEKSQSVSAGDCFNEIRRLVRPLHRGGRAEEEVRGELHKVWRAHDEPIQHFAMFSDSIPLIATAGSDQRVRLWTLDGRHLGSLRQGPLFDSSWTLVDALATIQTKVCALRVATLWRRLRKAVRYGYFRPAESPLDSPTSRGPGTAAGTPRGVFKISSCSPRKPTVGKFGSPVASRRTTWTEKRMSTAALATARSRSSSPRGSRVYSEIGSQMGQPFSPSPSPKHRTAGACTASGDPIMWQTRGREEVRADIVRVAAQCQKEELSLQEQLLRACDLGQDRREVIAKELRASLPERPDTPPQARFTQDDAQRELLRHNEVVRRRRSVGERSQCRRESGASRRHSRLASLSPLLTDTSTHPYSFGGASLKAALSAAPPIGASSADLRQTAWRSLHPKECSLVLSDTRDLSSAGGTCCSPVASPRSVAGQVRSSSCPLPRGGRRRRERAPLEQPALVVPSSDQCSGLWLPKLSLRHPVSPRTSPKEMPVGTVRAERPKEELQPKEEPKHHPLPAKLARIGRPDRPPLPPKLQQLEEQPRARLRRPERVARSSDRGSPLVGFVSGESPLSSVPRS